MRFRSLLALWVGASLPGGNPSAEAGTLRFAGYTWDVRSAKSSGPGPNHWDPHNVFLDDQGRLHLKLTQRNGEWYCAELTTLAKLGFGRYQFSVIGRIDQLDQNVVFGLFNYPTPDQGPDLTREIDMEFSRWGRPALPIGSYTVWPNVLKTKPGTKPYAFDLHGAYSTQRFTWASGHILFQSLHGHHDNDANEFSRWRFEPPDPLVRIPQRPLQLHLNLWCFQGRPPSNGREVEVVVRDFQFRPAAPASPGR